MRTVNNTVHGTHVTLASIHDMMSKLKALMEQSLPVIRSSMSSDEGGLMFEDKSLNIDKIAGQTSSLAAKCLTVAELVCDKITRSESIPDLTGETTSAVTGLKQVYGADSYTDSAQDRHLDFDFDGPIEHEDEFSRSDSDEAPEPLDVLTGHIENNYHMALEAIKSQDFDKAEKHILEAVSNAEERESSYHFPFDNSFRFTETHAFILTKQNRFVDAATKNNAGANQQKLRPTARDI